MKRVYLYLKNGEYSCYADISDEVEMPPYSTLIEPPESMINPHWINNQWVDKERVPDKVPNYEEVLTALPTTEQQLTMQQSQQIILMQTMVMQQNQIIVKLQSITNNKGEN